MKIFTALAFAFLGAHTVAAWSCETAGSDTTDLTKVSLSTYPLAVCNDGTPAAYYYAPATISTKIWLVYLAGKGWVQASSRV